MVITERLSLWRGSRCRDPSILLIEVDPFTCTLVDWIFFFINICQLKKLKSFKLFFFNVKHCKKFHIKSGLKVT